ncbi:MAG: bifunctional phosphoribosyl-AMP cyclohydrolase/phosphoribosyl-ATP diphosphatase HisIE [Hyphomonadaceae bacterium]|nr:bifunctional phosphoribosyl-AMP cyclohydrolase/phosphoribosyl-ATP diphosphatase HisIE [Hyphomonadaceae bacterium]
MIAFDPSGIDFEKAGGLVPAIVQDAATLQVLMLAYMDRAALDETVSSGEATFFSRSRGRRWRKGESSGNRLAVVSILRDCDADALLLRVTPAGPACHLGTTSCFGSETAPGVGRLAALERTIAARAQTGGDESWTAKLLRSGVKRVAQKVGEEGVECAIAGAAGDDDEVCAEAADLLYHTLVLLRARGVALQDVMAVLARRAEPAP